MSHSHSPALRQFVVFGILLLLLALTVGAAELDLGRWNFAVATLIACTKAVLILIYFMHVPQASAVTKMVVGASLVWLGILFVLAFADFDTRGWL